MAELKTKPTGNAAASFLNGIEDAGKKKDCIEICEMMEKHSGVPPKMWGDAIVGFGTYHYKYESGWEGDWFVCGFSPRKQNISLYLMFGFEKFPDLMKNLGKYKTGKSCLYINKISDTNKEVLEELIRKNVLEMEALKKKQE